MSTILTDRELIDSPILEKRATDWVNEVAPTIFKAFDDAKITYNDEMMCDNLKHGFMIGYATCWREVKGTDQAPS